MRQGDVYWLDLGEPTGSEPGYRYPHVVVQNDLVNSSKIRTAMVCAITSNLRLARAYGNVQLDEGEGGLPKPSVVNVSQVVTVDQSRLTNLIGRLSPKRVRQIVAGLSLLLEPRTTG